MRTKPVQAADRKEGGGGAHIHLAQLVQTFHLARANPGLAIRSEHAAEVRSSPHSPERRLPGREIRRRVDQVAVDLAADLERLPLPGLDDLDERVDVVGKTFCHDHARVAVDPRQGVQPSLSARPSVEPRDGGFGPVRDSPRSREDPELEFMAPGDNVFPFARGEEVM